MLSKGIPGRDIRARSKARNPKFSPLETLDGLDLWSYIDRKDHFVDGIADDLYVGPFERRRHRRAAVERTNFDLTGNRYLSELTAARDENDLVFETLPRKQSGVVSDPDADVGAADRAVADANPLSAP